MKKNKAVNIKNLLIQKSALDSQSIKQLDNEIEAFFITNGISAIINLKMGEPSMLGRFRIDTNLIKFKYLTITFKYPSDLTKYTEILKENGFIIKILEGVVVVQLP